MHSVLKAALELSVGASLLAKPAKQEHRQQAGSYEKPRNA
jgi:hypothetical protein